MSAKRTSTAAEAQNALPAKRAKLDPRHPTMLAPEVTIDPLEEDIAVGTSRKKDVRLDGYDSDSSDEGHGVERIVGRETENGPGDGGDDADDDDMFGEAPSAQAARHPGNHASSGKIPGKKQDRYLGLNDIQGQDFNTRTEHMDIVDDDDRDGKSANDDDDDDDDSVDEEVGALGRKHNAPKLDGFNMTAEMEEGKFDEDGNYIRTARDQRDNQDDWLKDVSRRDIAAARDAVQRRAREEAERVGRQDAADEREPVMASLAKLLAFLDRGETLLEALARLGGTGGGGPRQRRTASGSRKRGRPATTAAAASGEDAGAAEKVKRMTELANRLMAETQIEVYDTEREGLARIYQRETGDVLPVAGRGEAMDTDDRSGNEQEEEDPDDDKTAGMWEFVWAGVEDAVNGPYDLDTMRSWLQDGLLNTESTAALVRRVGEVNFVEARPTLFDA